MRHNDFDFLCSCVYSNVTRQGCARPFCDLNGPAYIMTSTLQVGLDMNGVCENAIDNGVAQLEDGTSQACGNNGEYRLEM